MKPKKDFWQWLAGLTHRFFLTKAWGLPTKIRWLRWLPNWQPNWTIISMGFTSYHRPRHAILADSIGFIQHLPHSLFAAFQSTLEEIICCDVLLPLGDCLCWTPKKIDFWG
jgi:hypothetical protein